MAIRRYRSKGSFGSGSSFSALVVSSSLGSLSIGVVCAGGSFYHGGGLVLHSILAGASDGFSSSSFSSSVLDGYGRVMVLVSLTVTACVWSSLTSQHYMGLLELLVVVCEAILCRLGSDYGVQRLRPVFLGSAPCTGRIRAK
ncbi:hypothetical protein Bca4012_045125 [Brassica carinata]